MRRASKRDANEPSLVSLLEDYGFLVMRNSAPGVPDLCAFRFGSTVWCEVKMPGESFTPEQVETFGAMKAKGVSVYVLEEPEDVDRLAVDGLRPWSGDGITVRDAKRTHTKKRPHRPGYDRARSGMSEVCVEAWCATSRLPGKSLCERHQARAEGRTYVTWEQRQKAR